MIQFGSKFKDVNIIRRDCAYGVIIGENDNYGIVEVPQGYYLVGGGIKESESHEDCLTREVKEEIGYEIEIIDFIGTAAEYMYSKKTNQYYNKIGRFYKIKILNKTSKVSEHDHRLTWSNRAELMEKELQDFLKWAIHRVLDN